MRQLLHTLDVEFINAAPALYRRNVICLLIGKKYYKDKDRTALHNDICILCDIVETTRNLIAEPFFHRSMFNAA